MAALPQSLPLDQVEGAAPSTASLKPTDFGLGQAANETASYANEQFKVDRYKQIAQTRQDQQTAAPYLQKLQEDSADSYSADAAAYTGDQPGFASDQIAKQKVRSQAVLASASSESPGVQAQLSHMVDRYNGGVGDQAIAHEAAVRAQPIAEMRQAQQQVQLSAGATAFQTTFAPLQAQLYDSYDGSKPGLTQDISNAWDQAATAAIAGTAPSQQPQLTARLAAGKTEEIAKASEVEAHGAIKYVLGAATTQADSLINSVTANPLSYDQASATLPTITANVPAAQRAPLQKELQGELAKARLTGLIDSGNPAQAQAELKDNRYGAVLQPEAVEGLMARADSAIQDHRPRSIDQATAQLSLDQRAASANTAIATTGAPSADAPSIEQMAAAFGPEKAALYQAQQTAAYQQHAVTGNAQAASMDALHTQAAAPMPDPSDPAYAAKLPLWEATTKAAQTELAAREKGAGGWAFSAGPPIKAGKAGVTDQMALASHGAQLQTMYQAVGQAPDAPSRAAAATTFARNMLGVQEAGGIPKTAWQIVPAQEAGRLAGQMTSAAPEQRLAAYTQVAQIVDAMPTSVRAQDGALVSPRALLARQLQAAGASATDISAIADYGADPTRLGRYVGALNDSSAAKPLDKNDEKALTAAVSSSLAPVLAARSPLPGEDLFRQARIDRTTLIARYLVQTRGMTPAAAAQSAAGDLTQGETLVNGQRIPAQVANATTWRNPIDALNYGGAVQSTGATDIRRGQAKVMQDLLNNAGDRLFAPSATAGNGAQQRNLFALQVQNGGRWVTSSDGSSSTLMVPSPRGGFTPVADRYGAPITASWGQLQTQANSQSAPLFGNPKPGTMYTAADQPLPAMSLSRAQSIFQQALVGTESNGQNGAISPKGALGRWQVMPQTAAPYAARIFGQQLDLNRLANDPAYNQAIGQARLGDAMRRWSGDPVLAAVDYNAGQGALTGYVDKSGVRHPGLLHTIGDPRTGAVSHGDFVSRMPAGETRDYVGRIAKRFSALASGG